MRQVCRNSIVIYSGRLLLPLACMVLSLLIFAAGGVVGSSAAIASEKGAEKFISTMSNNVLKVIQDDSLSDEQKEAKLREYFDRAIDFKWVGNFVLGKHRRKASKSQLSKYERAYRNFIINSYVKRFKDYTGESFRIISSRKEKKGKYIVETEIIRPKDSNVLVNYKIKNSVKNKKRHYKIYDIVIEGVSLITTQRSEFNSVITRKGLDFLITQLEKKANAQSKI